MRDPIKNWIDYNWFDGSKYLDEDQQNYIWALMQDGYTSGELIQEDNSGNTVRGWWEAKK